MTAGPSASAAPAGFAPAAMNAQRVFRAVMHAMARPGCGVTLPTATAAPDGLAPAAAALALTLCDRDTPVWLAPALRTTAITAWLRFHCGSPLAEPGGSAFAFAFAADAPALSDLDAGDPRYPDRSTTLVLLCEALAGGPRLRLTGPGIADEAWISPRGPTPALWEERAGLRRRFPLGIDLALVAEHDLIALPRTTRVAAED